MLCYLTFLLYFLCFYFLPLWLELYVDPNFSCSPHFLIVNSSLPLFLGERLKRYKCFTEPASLKLLEMIILIDLPCPLNNITWYLFKECYKQWLYEILANAANSVWCNWNWTKTIVRWFNALLSKMLVEDDRILH